VRRLFTAFVALFLATSAWADRPTTFAWDAQPSWPVGTTVELCANSVCATGITGTQHTLDVPVTPGQQIAAKVRAQSGEDVSEWTEITETWPAEPVGLSSQKALGEKMAIAYVNGAAANGGAVNATTISAAAINATTGNFIVVGFSSYQGAAGVVTGVTDTAGNTYQQAGSDESADGTHHASVWYAENITGNASNVVTGTYTGSSAYRCIVVAQFSGVALSGSYDQASTLNITSSGTTHTSGNTGTTTQADEVVVGSYIVVTGGSTLSGSAPTVLGPNASNNNAMGYKIVSSTGAQSTTLTSASSEQYIAQVRTFKAATGGGGATALPRRAIDGPFYGALRGSVR
jgi:hypothetical protein